MFMHYYWIQCHDAEEIAPLDAWEIQRLLTPRNQDFEYIPEGRALPYKYLKGEAGFEGRVPELGFYDVYAPIASGRVLSYVRTQLADLIQIIPIRLPRGLPECALLNITRTVACHDAKASKILHAYPGAKPVFLELHIDTGSVPNDALSFVETESHAIIVSRVVKNAIAPYCSRDVQFVQVS